MYAKELDVRESVLKALTELVAPTGNNAHILMAGNILRNSRRTINWHFYCTRLLSFFCMAVFSFVKNFDHEVVSWSVGCVYYSSSLFVQVTILPTWNLRKCNCNMRSWGIYLRWVFMLMTMSIPLLAYWNLLVQLVSQTLLGTWKLAVHINANEIQDTMVMLTNETHTVA